MAKISGKWQWNEILNPDGITVNGLTIYEINFTSNSSSYTSIVFSVTSSGYVAVNYRYFNYDTGSFDIVNITESYTNNTIAAYRVIDFGATEQEIDDVFYNWFIANAKVYSSGSGTGGGTGGDDNTGNGDNTGTGGGDNTGTGDGGNTGGGTGGSTGTPSSGVYVFCGANCRYEGMTKEQIYTAIMQAVNEGKISNIDAGFITTIKTINNNSIKFFYGTQAEYNALSESQKKNLHAIITDDSTIDGLTKAIEELKGDIESIYIRKLDMFSAPIESTHLTGGVGYYYIHLKQAGAESGKDGCYITSTGLVYWDMIATGISLPVIGGDRLYITSSGEIKIYREISGVEQDYTNMYTIYVAKISTEAAREFSVTYDIDAYAEITSDNIPYTVRNGGGYYISFEPLNNRFITSYSVIMGDVDVTNAKNADGTKICTAGYNGEYLNIKINSVSGNLKITVGTDTDWK